MAELKFNQRQRRLSVVVLVQRSVELEDQLTVVQRPVGLEDQLVVGLVVQRLAELEDLFGLVKQRLAVGREECYRFGRRRQH